MCVVCEYVKVRSEDCMFYVVVLVFIFFFFFKQKTAYEMRISDWSSDVCSSDLSAGAARGPASNPAGAVRSSPPRCRRGWSSPPSQIGRASCRERVCQYV